MDLAVALVDVRAAPDRPAGPGVGDDLPIEFADDQVARGVLVDRVVELVGEPFERWERIDPVAMVGGVDDGQDPGQVRAAPEVAEGQAGDRGTVDVVDRVVHRSDRLRSASRDGLEPPDVHVADGLIADGLVDVVRRRVGKIGEQEQEPEAGIESGLARASDAGRGIAATAPVRGRVDRPDPRSVWRPGADRCERDRTVVVPQVDAAVGDPAIDESRVERRGPRRQRLVGEGLEPVDEQRPVGRGRRAGDDRAAARAGGPGSAGRCVRRARAEAGVRRPRPSARRRRRRARSAPRRRGARARSWRRPGPAAPRGRRPPTGRGCRAGCAARQARSGRRPDRRRSRSAPTVSARVRPGGSSRSRGGGCARPRARRGMDRRRPGTPRRPAAARR